MLNAEFYKHSSDHCHVSWTEWWNFACKLSYFTAGGVIIHWTRNNTNSRDEVRLMMESDIFLFTSLSLFPCLSISTVSSLTIGEEASTEDYGLPLHLNCYCFTEHAIRYDKQFGEWWVKSKVKYSGLRLRKTEKNSINWMIGTFSASPLSFSVAIYAAIFLVTVRWSASFLAVYISVRMRVQM